MGVGRRERRATTGEGHWLEAGLVAADGGQLTVGEVQGETTGPEGTRTTALAGKSVIHG